MNYETILIKEAPGSLTITINRLARRNSINADLIRELNDALDQAEANPDNRLVILEGQQGIFCTGLDFEDQVQQAAGEDPEKDKASSREYMAFIRRLSLIPRIIISRVDGQVMAGGVGLAAASDLVIATPGSRFSLSEALWGLLPAMVTPYLIRRVGYQTAYRMTLTTLPLTAQEALAVHLVDEVNENPDASIQRLKIRLMRLENTTIGNMKRYFRSMWFISRELEELAISETSRLMALPEVKDNIRNFVEKQQFPWEKKGKSR